MTTQFFKKNDTIPVYRDDSAGSSAGYLSLPTADFSGKCNDRSLGGFELGTASLGNLAGRALWQVTNIDDFLLKICMQGSEYTLVMKLNLIRFCLMSFVIFLYCICYRSLHEPVSFSISPFIPFALLTIFCSFSMGLELLMNVLVSFLLKPATLRQSVCMDRVWKPMSPVFFSQ